MQVAPPIRIALLFLLALVLLNSACSVQVSIFAEEQEQQRALLADQRATA